MLNRLANFNLCLILLFNFFRWAMIKLLQLRCLIDKLFKCTLLVSFLFISDIHCMSFINAYWLWWYLLLRTGLQLTSKFYIWLCYLLHFMDCEMLTFLASHLNLIFTCLANWLLCALTNLMFLQLTSYQLLSLIKLGTTLLREIEEDVWFYLKGRMSKM